ncbi:MAG: ATP-dependent RecD-like DNA helicase [Planctomycetes bacterium]|nr:ATP-dependent RecD-like DNA helicase [Planctomycetota bacterium]
MSASDDSGRGEAVGDAVRGLRGTVERFTFRNAESGFAVVRLRPDGGAAAVQIVGSLAQLAEGQQITVSGRRSVHPRFGAQIEVDRVDVALPHDPDGIRAYLASSLVKGVGPGTADKLVDRFGTDTLRIIDEEPERLREIKGLGEKRIRELVGAVRAQRGVQDVMVFLRAHGLGEALAARIVKRLGPDAAVRIQADPYRLVDDLIGVGFVTADRLAQRLGLAGSDPKRVQAGILHALTTASRDGHCFVPAPELVERAVALLEVPAEVVATVLAELSASGRIVREQLTVAGGGGRETVDAAYPLRLHLAESGLARMLCALSEASPPSAADDAGARIAAFETRAGIRLADRQRLAIEQALTAPLSVVTGGPGVGKTTIVRAIAELTAEAGGRVLLAAPTGRAAKRLEESTGRPASTLHRLLEFQPGINRFLRDHEAPLEGDLLVVDETSMLDVQLAYDLFRAVPVGLRVVLVGDVDQLPSVGPGQVLGDVIAAGRVPVTRLDRVFRQTGRSEIVRAAHDVLGGIVPGSGPEGGDFFVIETDDPERARGLIRHVVAERIPSAFGLDPVADVQVLCPMYRGACGADALNDLLQQTLNPSGDEIERAGRRYRVGDKVLQVRNDYDLDLFNGDTGRITAIDRGEACLRVIFETREIEYPFADLAQLVPAYAITVHRAQGSEYPAVVAPLVTEHFVMLRRNLLYTAITRGRRLVVLIGSVRALRLAVDRVADARRSTGLATRLERDPPTVATER